MSAVDGLIVFAHGRLVQIEVPVAHKPYPPWAADRYGYAGGVVTSVEIDDRRGVCTVTILRRPDDEEAA